VKVLEATFASLENTIVKLADAIRDGTRLEPRGVNNLPPSWSFRQGVNQPTVRHERFSGFTFEVGGPDWSWRMTLGYRCDLLSDGNVHIAVGWAFDRLPAGQPNNQLGQPGGWHGTDVAINGGPRAAQIVAELTAEARSKLPDALECFARLVREVS
jgi:hypothetical protein